MAYQLRKIKFFKKNPKSIAFIAAILLIFLAYKLFVILAPHKKPEEVKVVEVEKVQLKDIKQTITLIGSINPRHATVLTAKEAGALDILHPSGQKVKKGTLIAKIDNQGVENNYDLAKAAAEIAKSQYQRLEPLYKNGHISKRDFENKKNNWILAQKAEADAKIALDKMRFYAPFDGIIGVYKAREGTQVKGGDPIVGFYDPSEVTVEFGIPAHLIKFIRDGQTVTIEGQDYPLTHVQRVVDEATHMCPAYININCADCILGTAIDLDLTIQQKNNVVVVPFEAVFMKDDKTFTYVVKNNKSILTPVKLGMRDRKHVEIIWGLELGQDVVLRGQSRIYPDSAVKIFKPPADKTK